MSKHTTGPWGYLSGGIVSNAGLVATVTDRPESDANARLIAAAPELLKALQDIVNASDCKMGTKAVQLRVDLARAVIAKAVQS